MHLNIHIPPEVHFSKIFHRGCMDFNWSSPSSKQLCSTQFKIRKRLLTVSGGQVFLFAHFFFKFRSIFLIFPQTSGADPSMVRIGTAPPPLWQINHANSAYFRLFWAIFRLYQPPAPPPFVSRPSFLHILDPPLNLTYFLPFFGPPGGQIAHPARPWLRHCFSFNKSCPNLFTVKRRDKTTLGATLMSFNENNYNTCNNITLIYLIYVYNCYLFLVFILTIWLIVSWYIDIVWENCLCPTFNCL